MQAPSSSWPTVSLKISCQGVWLLNLNIFLFFLLILNSDCGINKSTLLLFKSILIWSPVLMIPRSPPIADSGETWSIDGLAEVPLCLPSPNVGNVLIPFF